MKITNVCFSILFLVSCASDQQNKINIDLVEHPLATDKDAKELPMPRIQCDRVLHDFGEIHQDESLSIDFAFKNTGDAPLLIRSVKGSCGCTVPKYPKNIPIKPGETGEVEVNFDTNGRPDFQQKMVRVSANTTDGGQLLRIQAFVEPKNK